RCVQGADARSAARPLRRADGELRRRPAHAELTAYLGSCVSDGGSLAGKVSSSSLSSCSSRSSAEGSGASRSESSASEWRSSASLSGFECGTRFGLGLGLIDFLRVLVMKPPGAIHVPRAVDKVVEDCLPRFGTGSPRAGGRSGNRE